MKAKSSSLVEEVENAVDAIVEPAVDPSFEVLTSSIIEFDGVTAVKLIPGIFPPLTVTAWLDGLKV
jgi:hypothetical protein